MATLGENNSTRLTENSETVIVSLDGNIGSGKSRLLEILRQRHSINPKICFLQEPVSEWNTIKSKEGETIISLYYGNQEKYAFAFQMMAYISRLALLREALKKDYDIIITERSVFTDKHVFAKMLYDDEKIEEVEYTIYNKWFHEFLKDLPQLVTIYARTDPKVAESRVIKRDREGEVIPLAYLEKCHRYHEVWLNDDEATHSSAMLTLGANTDIDEHPEKVEEWLDDIEKFLGIPSQYSPRKLDTERPAAILLTI